MKKMKYERDKFKASVIILSIIHREEICHKNGSERDKCNGVCNAMNHTYG